MLPSKKVNFEPCDVFLKAVRRDEDRERTLFVFFFFSKTTKFCCYCECTQIKVDTWQFDWCITLICVTKINRVFLVSFALILKKLSWYRRRYGRLQWVHIKGTCVLDTVLPVFALFHQQNNSKHRNSTVLRLWATCCVSFLNESINRLNYLVQSQWLTY